MKSKDISEVRRSGSKNGYVIGYASTWIREPDGAGDVVMRGAFSDCIKKFNQEKKIIPLMFNHDNSNVWHFIGSVYHLEEDSKGLLFEAVYDDTPEAQRVRQLVNDGRLCKLSFSYDVLDEGKVRLPDGREANELRKLNVHEISLCLYPANRDTCILESKEEKEQREMNNLIRKAEGILKADSARKERLIMEAERLLKH